MTYKKDIDDVRESPALDIIKLLESRGGQVAYHDRHVAAGGDGARGAARPRRSPSTASSDYDCVVITTNHSDVDYERLVKRAHLVVDTRNATKDFRRDLPRQDRVSCKSAADAPRGTVAGRLAGRRSRIPPP